jgi:hypothetical protein
MNHCHITVVGARGGHGATAVAAVLALYAARQTATTLVSHDVEDAGALLGITPSGRTAEVAEGLVLAAEAGDAACVVEDCGTSTRATLDGSDACLQLAVLRGPCYLGLRTLVGAAQRLDGLVLLTEAGRCLGRRDVEDVVGVPVVAEVAVTDRVARTIDAGILVTRFSHLREFLQLARYIDRLDIPTRTPPARRHQPPDLPTATTASAMPLPTIHLAASSSHRLAGFADGETCVSRDRLANALSSGAEQRGGVRAQHRQAEPRGGAVLRR